MLDIDETSLSNYDAIQKDNFTFGTNSQAEATDETGVKIPSTLELFNLAKQNGVAVFFITGRREATRAHTESNLRREGYDGWQQLFLKPDASTDTTVQYKSGARGPTSRARATASWPTSATSTPIWPEATRTSGSSSPTRSTSCHRLAAWPATSTCSTRPVVRDFVAGVRAAIADAGSPAQACEAIRPRFAELLADPRLAPERFQEDDPESGMGGGIGQWLLFRADDRSLSLFSLVVPPGAQTPVHDHLAWGLVGLYRGTQDEEIYAGATTRIELRRAPRARARRLLRAHPAARRHPPRAHDLAADVGLDPPADQRHRLRLAPRLRRGLGRAHAVSLRLRQRALRRGLSRVGGRHASARQRARRANGSSGEATMSRRRSLRVLEHLAAPQGPANTRHTDDS